MMIGATILAVSAFLALTLLTGVQAERDADVNVHSHMEEVRTKKAQADEPWDNKETADNFVQNLARGKVSMAVQSFKTNDDTTVTGKGNAKDALTKMVKKLLSQCTLKDLAETSSGDENIFAYIYKMQCKTGAQTQASLFLTFKGNTISEVQLTTE